MYICYVKIFSKNKFKIIYLFEADQLLQETVQFTKSTERNEQLSDEFREMIKRERAEKAIGQSVTENTNLTKPKNKEDDEEEKKD